MTQPILETPRLILRPLQLADAERAQVLFPHWEIVRYLTKQVPWPYPRDGAYVYYRDVALPAIARGQQWHWTLRLKTCPEDLIGSIALMRGEKENRGFWLGLEWHGQALTSNSLPWDFAGEFGPVSSLEGCRDPSHALSHT